MKGSIDKLNKIEHVKESTIEMKDQLLKMEELQEAMLLNISKALNLSNDVQSQLKIKEAIMAALKNQKQSFAKTQFSLLSY